MKVSGGVDMWSEFRDELVAEMGSRELVETYVSSFHHKVRGDVQEASRLVYGLVVSHWGSLIQRFVQWVLDTTPPEAHIILLLRDAWPVGKVIQFRLANASRKHWTPLYLSRALLGIRDEATDINRREAETLLLEYINPLFEPNVVLVDTGCYGTLVVDLYRRYGLKLPARFFFSHNPYIPSFLDYLGVQEDVGEVLNDSIEVLLTKRHGRITRLRRVEDQRESEHLVRFNSNGVVPSRQRSGWISYRLHEATKLGLFHSAYPTDEQLETILMELVEMRNRAQDGEWTGILPRNTPTWKDGPAFLADYPQELRWVNPPELLLSLTTSGAEDIVAAAN